MGNGINMKGRKPGWESGDPGQSITQLADQSQ